MVGFRVGCEEGHDDESNEGVNVGPRDGHFVGDFVGRNPSVGKEVGFGGGAGLRVGGCVDNA